MTSNLRSFDQRAKLFSDLLVIIGLLIFAAVLFIASESIGDGSYESNIYAEYPQFFWVGIILILAIGFVQSFIIFVRYPASYRWLLGFGLIFLINLFVITLPYFRDYMFSGQWDSANHSSMILNITELGHPFSEDFYPISHLLAAVFSIISGVNVAESMNLTSTFFYIGGVMSMVFLAWIFDPSPRVRGILLLLSSLPIYFNYQTMFFPVQFSVYMLLYFLGWFLRTRSSDSNWKEVMIYVLILFFLPFLHPLAVIVPLVFFIIYLFSLVIRKFVDSKAEESNFSQILSTVFPGFIILLAGWFVWFSSFRAFGSTISHLYQVMREGITGFNSLESYVSASEKANLAINRILSLIVFTYGPGGGLLVITFAGLGLYLLMKKKNEQRLRKDFPSIPVFVFIFLVLAISSLFRDLITSNPLRYLNYAVVLAPLVIAPILNIFWNSNKQNNRIFPGFFATWLSPISFILISSVCVFNLYYSPLTGQPNNQFSYSRAAGAVFFLNHTNEDVGGIYSISARERIFRAVIPTEEIAVLLSGNRNWDVEIPPPHLGYGEADDTGINSFENPEYLIITGYGWAYYNELWTSGGRYTPEDFEMLAADPHWNCIYQSGDFTLWKWRAHD